MTRAEVHAAIRAAHGPGRAEWVWDRQMSELADERESVGKLLINPIGPCRWMARREGELVTRVDTGGHYRILIDEKLIGMRRDGRPIDGIWVDAPRFTPFLQPRIAKIPVGDDDHCTVTIGTGPTSYTITIGETA